jgi:N-acetylglucosaminyl-diphospho-decaprenol L-rhamnosyltransferase
MSVAVLIVNFRAYDALERCLASVERVLADGDEVVIVDHNSDEAALRRAAARCPRATTIARPDNPGFAAGVNRAAAHSRAPYLLLLNPDAEILDAVPRALEAWLASHPEVGVVAPRVLNPDGSVQPTARRFPGLTTILGGRSTWLTRTWPDNWLTRHNMTGRDATAPTDVDWVSGACLMTSRDLFTRLGGFDESFFLYQEDIDFCRRALEAGYRCTYVPSVTVRHVVGACSRFDPEASVRAFHESAYRYYYKHSGPVGRAAAPLVRAGLQVRCWIRRRTVLTP